MASDWSVAGRPISDAATEGFAAFVYSIENRLDGRAYIGRKIFRSRRKLPPLKGQKRARWKVVESDWKTYWGSSKALTADLERLGRDNFRRSILKFCKSETEAKYWELFYQMKYHVLLHPDKYYNAYVRARISRNQLL